MKLIKHYRHVRVDTLELVSKFVQKLHKHGYSEVTISKHFGDVTKGEDGVYQVETYYELMFECDSDREYSLLQLYVFV